MNEKDELVRQAVDDLLGRGIEHAAIMDHVAERSRREAKDRLMGRLADMDDVQLLTTVAQVMRNQPHSHAEVMREPEIKPGLATDMVIRTDPLGLNVMLVRAGDPDTDPEGVVETFISWMQRVPTTTGVLAYGKPLDDDTRAVLHEHASRLNQRAPERVSILEPDRIAEAMMQYGMGVRLSQFTAYRMDT